jgi:putative flippase GtrA
MNACALARWRRPLVFIVVGTAAAATHWLVVVALVERLHLAPLVANVGGWLVAFGVSFGGHFLATFGDRMAPLLRALRRFVLVSAAGFIVNEIAYATLLHGTAWRYDIALAAVLIGVAIATYLLSRNWAFSAGTAAE